MIPLNPWRVDVMQRTKEGNLRHCNSRFFPEEHMAASWTRLFNYYCERGGTLARGPERDDEGGLEWERQELLKEIETIERCNLLESERWSQHGRHL